MCDKVLQFTCASNIIGFNHYHLRGRNQARLQRNLMYLAAIADSQPQVPTAAQVDITVKHNK